MEPNSQNKNEVSASPVEAPPKVDSLRAVKNSSDRVLNCTGIDPLTLPFFLTILLSNYSAGNLITLPIGDSFDVSNSPCILTFPPSSTVKCGQKITLHFLEPGYFWCKSSVGDLRTAFSDNSLGSKVFTDLIYSSLPIPGPEIVYSSRKDHVQVVSIDSVTFTARQISCPKNAGITPDVIWSGVSTRNNFKILGPGTYNFSIPEGSSSFLFIGTGAGAGGGKYGNLTDAADHHNAVSGGGGGSGAFGAYTRTVTATTKLKLVVGSGGNAGQAGQDTELSVDSETMILGGGQTGLAAEFNKENPLASVPAQGGPGGQVRYFVAGNAAAFPAINFAALNGAAGGNAGPFAASNSTGLAGETFVTAPSFTSAGSNLQIEAVGSYSSVSAPGGGAGSYLGPGAIPASFKFAGAIILNWSQTAGGRAIVKNSAAGGAGQSPNDSDNLSRGAGGFGILIFN
jgi:hypothetical protein